MNTAQCNFCRKRKPIKEIELVNHTMGGTSYACKECREDPKNEINTFPGKFGPIYYTR